MLGAAGALCCLAAGTALGSWMRERRIARWRMLRSMTEAVGFMRLMLEQERPPLPEMIAQSATCAGADAGCDELVRRLLCVSEWLVSHPLDGAAHAYAVACARIPMPWEKQEERLAMERFFAQIGSGTAGMRLQAAISCLHRLKPLLDSAQAEAERGGRLCMQLGVLLGLMAGIALW